MVLLKKVGDVEIHVADSGQFSARVGGQDISRRSLLELEREIGRRMSRAIDLAVIRFARDGYNRNVGDGQRCTLALWEASAKRWRDDRGELLPPGIELSPLTPEVEATMAAFAGEREDLALRWRAFLAVQPTIEIGADGEVVTVPAACRPQHLCLLFPEHSHSYGYGREAAVSIEQDHALYGREG